MGSRALFPYPALVPENGFWHNSAESDVILACRSPTACGRATTTGRILALQMCQEASWRLLNRLEVSASALHDVTAATGLPKNLKVALEKQILRGVVALLQEVQQ